MIKKSGDLSPLFYCFCSVIANSTTFCLKSASWLVRWSIALNMFFCVRREPVSSTVEPLSILMVLKSSSESKTPKPFCFFTGVFFVAFLDNLFSNAHTKILSVILFRIATCWATASLLIVLLPLSAAIATRLVITPNGW